MKRKLDLPKVTVEPSILAADFGHVADEVKRAELAGADWLHLDIKFAGDDTRDIQKVGD